MAESADLPALVVHISADLTHALSLSGSENPESLNALSCCG